MKTLRMALAIAASIVSLSTLSGVAHAQEMEIIPLEITPLCAMAEENLAYWNVTNKNDMEVLIEWTALNHDRTGTYVTPVGHGQFASYYDASDPNNTTQFKSGTDTNQTNSSNTPCQPGQIDEPPVEEPPVVDPPVVEPPVVPVELGGRGGGEEGMPTPTAEQLANTGSSQVLPYAAAAVVALFTATGTVLVRKNVL